MPVIGPIIGALVGAGASYGLNYSSQEKAEDLANEQARNQREQGAASLLEQQNFNTQYLKNMSSQPSSMYETGGANTILSNFNDTDPNLIPGSKIKDTNNVVTWS